MPSDLAVAETTRLSQHHFLLLLFLWGVSHQPRAVDSFELRQKSFRHKSKIGAVKKCSKRKFVRNFAGRCHSPGDTCFELSNKFERSGVFILSVRNERRQWLFRRNIGSETSFFSAFAASGKVDSLPNMSIKKFCLIRSRCPRNEPEGGLLLFALQSTMIAAKVSRALKMSQKSVMTTKRWKWFRSKSLIVLRSLEKQQFRPLCWWMKSNRCLFLNYPQIMSSKHSCYHQIDRVRKKCSRCAQNRWPVSCQLFSSISDPLWGLGVASTRVVSAL